MDDFANQEPAFDWYMVVSGETALEQGDLLDNFPIVIPPVSMAEIEIPDEPVDHEIEGPGPFNVERFNVIVMTQSCDFIKLRDEDEVILCPRSDYSELVADNPNKWGRSRWKSLINGRVISAHIINKSDIQNHELDYQVIDLGRIFSVPLSLVKQVAINQGNRVRLLPPYREHLAQAFARQFMRVGLPIDLPRDFPYPT